MLNRIELAKRIAGFAKAQAKTNDELQIIAVSLIGHAKEHGDVTLADTLLDAMKGGDRQAMIAYLEGVGCFAWSKANGKFKLNKSKRDKFEFDEAYLMGEKEIDGEKVPMWYDYCKPKKALNSTMDVETLVDSIIKRAAKAQEEGKEVKNARLAEYLTDALIKYHLALVEVDEVIDYPEPVAE